MVDSSWLGLFFRTALMYASLLGLSTTVEMLLKRGANPQLTDSSDHTGIIKRIRPGKELGKVQLITYLINVGMLIVVLSDRDDQR